MLSSLGNNRVARFIWLAGKEFIPEPVKLPVSLARHFRDCFFVTSPQERLELYAQLAAADEKATREIEEMIRKEWENILPAGRKLPVGTTAVVRGLVESLRAAGKEKNASDDAQLSSLEGVLGAQVLAGGDALPPASLNPQQVQLGRLVVSSALRAAPDIGTGLPAFPQIPGYQIKRFLKQGGFGQVYVAYHEASDTLRAVKVGDAAEHKRLDRELKLAREFDSPHLVKYLDHGKIDGRYWIAMDYLSEQSLGEMLETAGGKFDPELALLIGEQVLTGLSVLHANNVIHRDLTPNNVMADASFRLRLIDFGLARPIGGIGVGTGTTTGSIVGTAYYMSPEQLRGADLTLAADVYSFGVLLFRLFTGAEPHRGVNIVEQALEVLNKNPDLQHSRIPPELHVFLGKCLAKTSGERFTDAGTALKAYTSAATEARSRVRYERFAAGWNQLFDANVLEVFVERYDGPKSQLHRAFAVSATEAGVVLVDEERLADVLPSALAHRGPILREIALLSQAQELTKPFQSLPPTDRRRQSADNLIRAQEDAVAEARAALKATIRTALRGEVLSWRQKVAEQEKASEEARQRAEREELRQRKLGAVGVLVVIWALVAAAALGAVEFHDGGLNEERKAWDRAEQNERRVRNEVEQEQKSKGIVWIERQFSSDPRVDSASNLTSQAARKVWGPSALVIVGLIVLVGGTCIATNYLANFLASNPASAARLEAALVVPEKDKLIPQSLPIPPPPIPMPEPPPPIPLFHD